MGENEISLKDEQSEMRVLYARQKEAPTSKRWRGKFLAQQSCYKHIP